MNIGFNRQRNRPTAAPEGILPSKRTETQMKLSSRIAPLLLIAGFTPHLVGCQGSAESGGATPTPIVAPAADLETQYSEAAYRALVAHLETFKESCRAIEGEGSQPLPARTGPILLAEPVEWDPAKEEMPRLSFSQFVSERGQTPKCVALIYTRKTSLGKVQVRSGSFFGEEREVEKVKRDRLVFMVDLQEGFVLGSKLFPGQEPSAENPTPDPPQLNQLLKGPLYDPSPIRAALSLVAEKAGKKEWNEVEKLLSNLGAGQEVAAEFRLAWGRATALSPIPSEFQVSTDYVQNTNQGLEFGLTLTDTQESLFKFVMEFRGGKLERVDPDWTEEELKSYVQKVAAGQANSLESPTSAFSLATACLDLGLTDSAEKIAMRVLRGDFGSADAQTSKEAGELSRKIATEKALAHADEVKELKAQSLAFLKTDEFERSIVVLKKAALLNPDDDEVALLLIRSYDANNDVKTAVSLIKKFELRFPTSNYGPRVAELKKELAKKSRRAELGGDVTARFKITGKPTTTLDSYVSFYPSDVTTLNKKFVKDIDAGSGSRAFRYGVPTLYRDVRVRLIKTACYRPQTVHLNRQYRYRSRESEPFDAALVEVLDGEYQGQRGWVRLTLVDYQDIGYASEPFALPMIFPEEAESRG